MEILRILFHVVLGKLWGIWQAWTTSDACILRSVHDAAVRTIQRGVKKCPPRKRLSLRRSNSQTHCTRKQSYKNGCHLVDVSALTRVIAIDTERMTIDLEPACRMDQITRVLQKHGCSLPVTPEFKGITIGGTIAGGGLESTSFRYGLVQACVLEFDIILGDGSLVTASPESNADLFYGTMWALGTTGIVVRVRSSIIRAAPWVHLQYTYFDDRASYVAAMTRVCREQKSEDVDFVEGVELDSTCAVLITGRRREDALLPLGVERYNNHMWYDQWFIQHIESKPSEAVMTLNDYLFRWDRGVYWNARRKINPTRLNRFLFGWLFDMETSHAASRMKSDRSNEKTRVLTDVGPSLTSLQSMMDYNESAVHVYPIWHLPFRLFPNDNHIFSCEAVVRDEFCVDYGIYGRPTNPDGSVRSFDVVELNRGLEDHVHNKCGGMKGFETVCYYTKDEFHRIFDIDQYNALRRKYKAQTAFPTVLEKVTS